MNPARDSRQAPRAQHQSNSATRLKFARQWHLYLGTLFAPSIIFFAFSGSLQLFSLHEGHPGDAYQPPAWIQTLASIHKDQVLSKKHKAPAASAGEQKAAPVTDESLKLLRPEGAPANEKGGSHPLTFALKWFFLAMGVGLIFSTSLGIYMAFKFNRSRALVWGMLLLGTAIPLALIALMT
jgi:hypothetical protein